MKKFIVNLGMVTLGLVALVTVATCEAANPEHDLRTGTFQGNWCGFPAEFNITKKFGKTWFFEGTLFIPRTKQLDKITIEQRADNHLIIRRHLSGSRDGQYQVLVTHRPEMMRKNGVVLVNWAVSKGSGPGSNNLGHLHMPKL